MHQLLLGAFVAMAGTAIVNIAWLVHMIRKGTAR